MVLNMRSLVAIALPAFGVLLGLFWFRKRKNSSAIEYPKPPDKTSQENNEVKENFDSSISIKIKERVVTNLEDVNIEEEDIMVQSTSSTVCSELKTETEISEISNNNSEVELKSEELTVEPESSQCALTSDAELTVEPESSQCALTSDAELTVEPESSQCALTSDAELTVEPESSQCALTSDAELLVDPESAQCDFITTDINLSGEKSEQESIDEYRSELTDSSRVDLLAQGDFVMEDEPKTAMVDSNIYASGDGAVRTHCNGPPEEHQCSVSSRDSSNSSDHSTESETSVKSSNCDKSKSRRKAVKGGCDTLTNGHVTEEVLKTLTGENLRTRTSAVLSDSPILMNSNVSSDAGSCDHDLRSEVSADSGRGGSVVEMSSPVLFSDAIVVYEFDFPTDKCGLLIGKHGRNINRIKDIAGVEITVNNKLYTSDYQLVALEGTQASVDKALSILRDRFPIDRFPDIPLEPALTEEGPMLQPEMMQLSLPVGVFLDVLVSSVVSPNHIFLQQPTHPSYHMLETLNVCMNQCYVQDGVVPQLPRPIEVGVICAAPMLNTGWYRSQIVQSFPETDEVELKFVDYGGYMSMSGSLLRQIRSDFSQLPFQAVECYMANVVPPKDAEVFPIESNATMELLVQGKLLQAQVIGQEADGVPYVQLYDIQQKQPLFVNRELVDRGVAQWSEHLL